MERQGWREPFNETARFLERNVYTSISERSPATGERLSRLDDLTEEAVNRMESKACWGRLEKEVRSLPKRGRATRTNLGP